jgi:GAF domain/ANTAR domain
MLEPIPETLEAIKELIRFGGDDIAKAMLKMSRGVQSIVPECVGLSLGLVDDDVALTAVATDQQIAELDAVQYLDGGPCAASASTGEPTDFQAGDVLDEARWALFARASAALGVASTLSLPIVREARVVAGVNLYASTADAFEGHHEELAVLCGAWAPGAVANADLAFRSRLAAAQAPERLRDLNAIDTAIGMLMESQQLSDEVAVQRLREAADRAGITEGQAARVIIRALLPN